MTTFANFMTDGGWAVSSLVCVVFTSITLLMNQHFKIPGHILVFFLRLITVILMTPFMFYIPWPETPIFYIVVISTALFGAFSDIRLFNVSAKYGAGVTARTLPLVIFLSFILWFFFDPELFVEYSKNPINTIGIVSSLLGCVYFSSQLKKCNISRAAFIAMLPVIIGYTINTSLNKFSMQQGDYTGVVFGYMYLQSVAAIFFIGGYALWREKKLKTPNLCKKKVLLATTTLSILWILGMTFQNYAMIFVPSPSYQIAILQLAPVLIAIFYYFVKHKEEADVKSGFGVVACAILLVLAAI